MAWQELDKPWHDTNVDYCDVCGNLIVDRAWVFTAPDGSIQRACRESDEGLYATLREYAPAIDAARSDYERQRDSNSGRAS